MLKPPNVLLIHPPVRERAAAANLPLGTAYTASALKAANIKYQVLDLNIERSFCDIETKTKNTFRRGGFTHVGISAMVTQFNYVEKIISWIRAVDFQVLQPLSRCTPIILGGPITVLASKLVRWFSVLVYKGESEREFASSLGFLFYEDGTFLAKPIKSLRGSLLPDWESFDMQAYANNPVGAVNRHKWSDGRADKETPRSMNLLGSRGCPNQCSYCAHDFAGTTYRVRPATEVVAEMELLRGEYGIEYFHTSDDNTTANGRWVTELCNAIRNSEVLKGCTWGCAGRVDTVNRDMLQLMYDSGCRVIGYGVESGSQAMLDEMRKGVTVKQIEDTIMATKEVFGLVDYSLIVGTPGENDVTIAETIDLCQRTETRPEVVFYMTPYPGTELYRQALKNKLIGDDLLGYVRSLGEQGEQIACNVSGQSDNWLKDAKSRIISETAEFGGLI